jgi:hypothetical protein
MSRWLLVLLLAAVASQEAAGEDARPAIDACLATLDPAVDTDYHHIAARCPGLEPALARSASAAWLLKGWNRDAADNLLSPEGLRELRELLSRAEAAPQAAHAPRVSSLAAVLARLPAADAAPLGWWARFKQWLREALRPDPQRAAGGWLRRLFGDLGAPQAVVDVIVWSSLAVVVALALAVLTNELRVAGLLRRRPRSTQAAATGATGAASLTLADLERLEPSEQPQLLWQLLTARLGEQERLPPAGALTVREVLKAARLAREADREPLTLLAAVCERLRFSGEQVAPPALAVALNRGRELLAALEIGAAPGAL